MVGGVCGVRGDVIPYRAGQRTIRALEGLNIIGMKRRKFTRERLAKVRSFYQKLFDGPGVFSERLAAVQPMASDRSGDRGNPAIYRGRQASSSLPAVRPRTLNRDDGVIGRAHDCRDFGSFVAGWRHRRRWGDAVCRGRFPEGARPGSRSVCTEGRLRSRSHRALSSSLDYGGPNRPGEEAVSRGKLQEPGLHRNTWCGRRLSEIRLDWGTLRAIARIWSAFRGGDDHLLSGIGRIFEQEGFRLLGLKDVAPDLLMPEGSATRNVPDRDAVADIARGQEVLRALGAFDVGQAVVVIDGHVVGVEGIEGTDELLARIATLRAAGRIRTREGRGVLVKAPKSRPGFALRSADDWVANR